VLARALVVVTPVQGSAGPTVGIRTNVYGAFETPALPAGAYLVSVSRRSFAPAQYGQKRWKAPGVPVFLEEAQSTFLNIRLPRFGSVTGTILDENEVGLPEHDVVIYRTTRPPQLVTRVKTDDRGMYRIAGLEPGRYLIRTVGRQYEEGGYLPTFHKEVTAVDQAYQIEVDIDRETTDVNVRPLPGQLFTIAGQAIVPAGPPPVQLTLVSDTGSEATVADGAGNFKFNPMAPGRYELYAQAPGDSRGPIAAFIPLEVDRDRGDIRIALRYYPQVTFIFRDSKGQLIDPGAVQVLARRKDLAGEGKPENLRLSKDIVTLLPGRSEIALAPDPKYYVESVYGQGVVQVERRQWLERNRGVRFPAAHHRAFAIVLQPRQAARHGDHFRSRACTGRAGVPGVVRRGRPPTPDRLARSSYRYPRPIPVLRPGSRQLPPGRHIRIPVAGLSHDGIGQPQDCADRRRPRHAARSGSVRNPVNGTGLTDSRNPPPLPLPGPLVGWEKVKLK